MPDQLFSLQPILQQTFDGSSIKHIASSPPGYLYASGSDGSFKLVDATIAEPLIVEDLPIQGGSLSPSKKAVERLAVLTDIQRVVCLAAGGNLSFHSIPSLEVVSAGDAAGNTVVNSNTVKGVLSFAVDEYSATAEGTLVAIMKRKGIALFLVSRSGVQLLHEVAINTQIVTAMALRDSTLCFADVERYSLMDLEHSQLMPLLPISQDPRQPGDRPNPDQRPSIVPIDNAEYLVASHTASTTLGVFISAETGDPCRGTVEWPSNVRSLAVEGQFIIALLLNKTIEIHDIETQQLVQLVRLTESTPDPRQLISSSPFLLQIPWTESPAAAALRMVPVALAAAQQDGDPLKTPPASPVKAFTTAPASAIANIGTFLITRNAIFGLRPLGIFEQAEALFQQGKMRETLELVSNNNNNQDEGIQERQLRGYYNFKIGLHYVIETDFDEAAACLSRACGDGADPRLILRLFPDLCLDEWATNNTQTSAFYGVMSMIHTISKSIDQVILANLYKNYSPHIKPEAQAVSLQDELNRSARAMVKLVLASCYAQGAFASEEVKKAVITALAKLAAEDDQSDECLVFVQEGPIATEGLLSWLRMNERFQILAQIYDELGFKVELIQLWLDKLDSDEPLAGTRQIAQAILNMPDAPLKRKFALEVLSRDQQTGLHILWAMASQQTAAEALDVYQEVSKIKEDAAELYLEGSIFRVVDEDPQFSQAFTNHCLRHLAGRRSIDRQARTQDDRLQSLPEELLELMAGQEADFRPMQTRLLFMLFLATKTTYDAATLRNAVEKVPALSFERAMILGRLGLHRQALATLVKQAQDIASAEVYCLSKGVPFTDYMARKIASQLGLPSKHRPILHPGDPPPQVNELLQVLIDILLNSEDVKSSPLLTGVLISQAAHLDTQNVLDRIPEDTKIKDLESFVVRGLVRSTHEKHEAMVLKPLAAFQAMLVDERLYEKQRLVKPTVQQTSVGYAPQKAPDLLNSDKDKLADKIVSIFGEKVVE